MTGGWLLLGVLLLATALLLPQVIDEAWMDAERRGLQAFLDQNPITLDLAIWVETPGNAIFVLPVVICAALYFIYRRRPLIALTVLASFCLAAPLTGFGWLAWARPRPELVLDGLASSGFSSFPSGHTVNVISVYGFLAYLWARATPAWAERLLAATLAAVFCAVVVAARLALSAHWLSDIVGGFVFGSAWLLTMIVVLRRAERRLAID